MSLFSHFNTLRHRIVVGEGALVLGTVVVAVLGIAALGNVSDTVSDELQVSAQVGRQSNAMVSALFDQIRAAEQFLADGSPTARTRFREAGDSAYASRRRLRSLAGLQQDGRLAVTSIADVHARAEAWYSYAHALQDLGVSRARARRQAADSARALATTLIGQLRDFSTQQATAADQTTNVLVDVSRNRQVIMWLVVVIAVIGGTAIVLATVASLTNPLTRLKSIARRLGEGNLQPVRLGAMPRELEDLGGAITGVGTQLRSLVLKVRDQSERILAAAADLSAMSERLATSGGMISTAMTEMSQGARLQVSSLQEGDKATEALRKSAKENLDRAGHVAAVGSQIQRLADRHRQKVEAAGGALLDLGQVVQQSAQQVEQLAKLFESVDEFVELIKQVSSQTNLLALNAAIEAARAGEGGQGFAVVADEVRQLADSSSEAAESANSTIKNALHQVSEVASTMAAGRQQVKGIESVAQGAAVALNEITQVIGNVEQEARAVANGARANMQTVDQIETLMRRVFDAAQEQVSSSEQVSASTQEQSASTQQIAAQAAELTQAAEQLRTLIDGLRT